MNKEDYGVHATHCCSIHGCKYNDPDCPVVAGLISGIVCEECMGEAHDDDVTDRIEYYQTDIDVLNAWCEFIKREKSYCTPSARSFVAGFNAAMALKAAKEGNEGNVDE